MMLKLTDYDTGKVFYINKYQIVVLTPSEQGTWVAPNSKAPIPVKETPEEIISMMETK
jgi:hypothetical protein